MGFSVGPAPSIRDTTDADAQTYQNQNLDLTQKITYYAGKTLVVAGLLAAGGALTAVVVFGVGGVGGTYFFAGFAPALSEITSANIAHVIATFVKVAKVSGIIAAIGLPVAGIGKCFMWAASKKTHER